MKKAPEAFRTISEVAEILETPAHVLRFWESKFYQIRPVKRAGGRRYYRPDDVALINGIRHLLQVQGMTIRGVQRVLQEQGIKAVVAMGGPLPHRPELLHDRADTILEGSLGLDDSLGHDDGLDAVIDEATLVDDDLDADPDADTGKDSAVADDFAAVEADLPPPAGALPAQTAPDAVPERPGTTPPVPPATEQPVVGPDALAVEGAATPAPNDAPGPVPVLPLAARDITRDSPRDAPREPAREPSRDHGLELSERAGLAHQLRAMPRGAPPGPQRDRMGLLARRIDALLERMSEASGAGRW